MSIIQAMHRLDGAKRDIATAISKKGVAVPPNPQITQLAPLIKEIKSGGPYLDVIITDILPAHVVEGRAVILTSSGSGKITFSYSVPADPAIGDIWVHMVDNGGYTLAVDGSVGMVITPGMVTRFNGTLWDYCNAYIGHQGEWKMFSTHTAFCDLQWEHIIAIANSGEDCSQFFSVGDEHQLALSNGEYISVIIGDFNKNQIYIPTGDNIITPYSTSPQSEGDIIIGEGGDAPGDIGDIVPPPEEKKWAALALSFKECLSTRWPINEVATTVNLWVASDMDFYYMPDLFNAMPAALKAENAIKEVVCLTHTPSEIYRHHNKLRLHSVRELGLSYTYADSKEGEPYAYYTSAARRIKALNGENTTYWTRSPRVNGTNQFCYINANGGAGNTIHSTPHGVACAFDI